MELHKTYPKFCLCLLSKNYVFFFIFDFILYFCCSNLDVPLVTARCTRLVAFRSLLVRSVRKPAANCAYLWTKPAHVRPRQMSIASKLWLLEEETLLSSFSLVLLFYFVSFSILWRFLFFLFFEVETLNLLVFAVIMLLPTFCMVYNSFFSSKFEVLIT